MALTTATAKVLVRPIEPSDFRAVGQFMHEHLNQRVLVDTWVRALDVPWDVEQPNAGFMLVSGDAIVGVNLAVYSERVIEGRIERFCDIGAWCVLPEHRLHGLRLLKALLAQDGYHFTDLSPSGNVVAINSRLGFAFLDTTTTVVPNVPWPSRPGRDLITHEPAALERTLTGHELAIYRDHAAVEAAQHLLLARGGEHCYVIWRKDRRKGLPLFASILYVSHHALFRAMAAPLGRHLLLRHRLPATLVERAVVDHRPRLSRSVDSPRRKMFRSPSLEPAQIDYLYSELVRLPW